MLAALVGNSFEGGFPMRMVLLIIAVAVTFVLWDRFQNEGRYTAQMEASFRQAAADLPSGSYGHEIRFNRDLMKR
ncbi:hypothetical protein LJR234_004659 [Mesorhizobium amorphae]|uniref:hypothetical protein n=1 Tax=Mesorhizobium amorphae TaxID=71433 RepID=UPI003ED121A8